VKERRQEAVRISEGLISDPKARMNARRILVEAWSASDPRRALEQASLILKEDKTAEDARVSKLMLLIRMNDVPEARRTLQSLSAPAPENKARVDLARAHRALEIGGDRKDALESAEAAATEDPRSNEALLLLSRALLANGEIDRALAFANELFARRPHDVDPFLILRVIHDAKGDAGQARALALRSQGWRSDEAKVTSEVARREKVIRAVRDAEAGLGIAGADAVRGQEPLISLPLDFLIARRGAKGSQHAARDRILASCAPELARFLRSTGGWSRFSGSVSPYGDVETVDRPLSAADPGRCAHAPQTRRPRH
jgi:tetratricopeptide (TPR) repeat protein